MRPCDCWRHVFPLHWGTSTVLQEKHASARHSRRGRVGVRNLHKPNASSRVQQAFCDTFLQALESSHYAVLRCNSECRSRRSLDIDAAGSFAPHSEGKSNCCSTPRWCLAAKPVSRCSCRSAKCNCNRLTAEAAQAKCDKLREETSSSSSPFGKAGMRGSMALRDASELSRCSAIAKCTTAATAAARQARKPHSTSSTLYQALVENSHQQPEIETESVARALLDDTSDLALKPKNQNTFRMLLIASIRARAARFAPNTNNVDKSYWKKWCELCRDVFDTNPVRWYQQASIDPAHKHHPREVHLALSAFVFWCLHESQFKPSSMLARLRGVAREHRKRGLRFVDLRLVVDACKGILRILVAEHGPEVAEVKRKEPLQPWMLRRWLALPVGMVVGAYRVGPSLAWFQRHSSLHHTHGLQRISQGRCGTGP